LTRLLAAVLPLLGEAARHRGVRFKQSLDEPVRSGLGAGARRPYRLRAADLGTPSVPIAKSLQLVADAEDEELVRRLEAGTSRAFPGLRWRRPGD